MIQGTHTAQEKVEGIVSVDFSLPQEGFNKIKPNFKKRFDFLLKV